MARKTELDDRSTIRYSLELQSLKTLNRDQFSCKELSYTSLFVRNLALKKFEMMRNIVYDHIQKRLDTQVSKEHLT